MLSDIERYFAGEAGFHQRSDPNIFHEQFGIDRRRISILVGLFRPLESLRKTEAYASNSSHWDEIEFHSRDVPSWRDTTDVRYE